MLVLSASFAVVVVGAFLVLVLAIGAQRSAGRTALRAQEAIAAGRALETTALTLDNGVRGYVITGRKRSLAPYTSASRAPPPRPAAPRAGPRGPAPRRGGARPPRRGRPRPQPVLGPPRPPPP